jgi:molybdate transport system substrate-binding protein
MEYENTNKRAKATIIEYTHSLLESSLDSPVTILPDLKITDVNKATQETKSRTQKEPIISDYFTQNKIIKAKQIKHFRILIIFSLLINIFSLISGCGTSEVEKKELLIYCGITMIKPMSDIARIIEKQENCTVTITKGGSGNLFRSIKANNVGDLYLPGSDSYIKKCLKEGIVTDTVFVGYNMAAIMVQKGNPKGITSDLNNFINNDYYTVICNPDSGSIGKETKKIFEKRGIYKDVLDNVHELTTDSKDLILFLKDKKADLVINWYATSQWFENKPHVDILFISDEFAGKKKLVIGLLKTSKYPEIARTFMMYAASEKGRELFKKYGLYNAGE